MDLVLVLVTVGFFALSWAYTHGCERLLERTSRHDLRIRGRCRALGAAHRLPRLRPAPTGALLGTRHDSRGLVADIAVLRARARGDEAAGPVSLSCVRGRAPAPAPGVRPGGAPPAAPVRRGPEARADLGAVRGGAAGLQPVRRPHHLRH